jgi:glycerol kinase
VAHSDQHNSVFLQTKIQTMKAYLLSIALVFASVLTISAQKAEYYGEKIKANGAISTSEFVKQIEGKDSLTVKMKVKINEACKKKGCWMNVDLGDGKSMMVRFKDYGFFVPKDSDGFDAIIEGEAFREEVSVDMLRHFAEDAGKSKEEIAAITKSEVNLSFEAKGVIIYPTKK